VRITLCVSAISVAPLSNVRIEINGRPVDYEIHNTEESVLAVELRTQLNESDYSILTLYTPEMARLEEQSGNGDLRRGMALSDIVIEPTGSGFE
jgi:hypothetical protein